MKSITLKHIIQFSISILLFGILFYSTDFREVGKSFSNAQYHYIFAAFLSITINRFIMGTKWKLLLNAKGIYISPFECIKIYYIANFLGLFLPPTIGTDIVRSLYIPKNNNSRVDTVASIIIERVIGFIVLFLSAVIGFTIILLYFEHIHFNKEKMIFILLGLTLLSIILFFLSINKGTRRLSVKISRYLNKNKKFSKILIKVNLFIKSYQDYKYHKLELFIFLILTFFEVFTNILWSYFSALALNVEVNLLYFIAFVPITLVFIRMPISIDGFGIQESLYIYFLMQVGISQSLGFSIGFLNHIITIIGILPGGIFYALNKRTTNIAVIDNSFSIKNGIVS